LYELTICWTRDEFAFDVGDDSVDVDAESAREHGSKSVVVAACKDEKHLINFDFRLLDPLA